MIDLSIGYHDELAADGGDRPVPDAKKLPKVPDQYEVGLLNGSKHALTFACHFGMSVDDMLPALVRQPNVHVIDRQGSCHESGRVTLGVQSSTTTL
jgi:hypothetical protein